MFETDVYAERRSRLIASVETGVILLTGNEESSMNYRDNLYPFRQDSSFLYFFGIDRPGLVGVIDIDNDKETLYGDDLTTEEMVWVGFREPLGALAARAGIHAVRGKKYLPVDLAEAVLRKRKVHFLPPYRPEHVVLLEDLLGTEPSVQQGMASVKLIKAIVAQRSYKSPEEIQEIETAVSTTVDMQLAAIGMGDEGVTEARIAGALQAIAVGAGGDLSFPTILTMQGEILHNGFSQSPLAHGRLVLCDCGAETRMHYAGDLTRTFPVSKKFTPIQRDIYDIVLAAHEAAVAMLKPGILFRDVHLFACEHLADGLRQLGILKGDVREAVAAGAHALFFPCGLGHMMGLDTHDMENLGEPYVGYTETLTKSKQFGLKSLRLGRALEEGFVITVEPGLYFNRALIDEWAASKKAGSFINYDRLEHFREAGGTRIEEDFLITAYGQRLLGKPLAKTAAEMEELRLAAH